jgi:hypothetical protein
MANGTLKVGTITTSSGSGNITIGSGVTVNVNRPAWYVKLSGDQDVSSSTQVKVTWDTEVIDTDGAFASNKFTVPTGQDGKYFFYYKTAVDDLDDGEFMQLNLYKNGSESSNYLFNVRSMAASYTNYGQISGIIDLSAGDYLETYIYQSTSGTQHLESAYSLFAGYKVGA